eukprot:441023_1
MNLFHIIVIAHIIVNTHAYLSEIAVKTLNKLYNEWNGKYWSPCQWNMTQINNTNQNNKINDQCGLMFSSNLQNFQSVTRIDFASVHTIINNINKAIVPNIKQQYSINNPNDQVYESSNETSSQNWDMLLVFIYFLLLIIVAALVFAYGLFGSLPSNNVFGVDSYYALKSITTPISIILTGSKAFLIPNFITKLFKTFNISNRHRNNVVMFLRTIFVIVIPLSSSIFFINECVNGWAKSWNECSNQNKDIFDININVTSQAIYDQSVNLFYKPQFFEFTGLLSAKEVCSTQFPSSDHVLKCFRQFYYLWIDVLFQSLLTMLLIPIAV